ncbi:hypothetical protein [Pseudodesulfovibrio methanolicus]|uniref:Uncharacterized protein n=1 Tax=Pseudodesulfovibrio methanolicus TaxID=3126690 RepID=A0ABZ2IYC7_9BACT
MAAETDQSEFHLIEGPKVKAWKEGVAPLLASVAIFLACDSEPLFHKLNAIRSGEIRIIPENIPDTEVWFSYYRSHKKLLADVTAFYAPLQQEAPNGHGPQDILTEKEPLPSDIDAHALLLSLTPAGTPELNNLDLDWHNSPPALLFFILIWVPCNCIWGENPPELLFRARHGDLDAARKLIQLDKSIISEQGIARKIRKWSAEARTDKLAQIGSFLGESIPDVSLQQVKLTWARFILDTSLRAGQRMPAPKIQELFNAIAQDSGRGLQDPDIGGMTPEAFAKALTRRKDFWKLSTSR